MQSLWSTRTTCAMPAPPLNDPRDWRDAGVGGKESVWGEGEQDQVSCLCTAANSPSRRRNHLGAAAWASDGTGIWCSHHRSVSDLMRKSLLPSYHIDHRSEERRVGKECRS